MKNILVGIFVLIFIAPPANASRQSGYVQNLRVRSSDGLVFFDISGDNRTAQPECASHTYWMLRDENSEAGKKQYAMLLAAQSAHKKVTVYGSDTCLRWGDGEDVNIVILGD